MLVIRMAETLVFTLVTGREVRKEVDYGIGRRTFEEIANTGGPAWIRIDGDEYIRRDAVVSMRLISGDTAPLVA